MSTELPTPMYGQAPGELAPYGVPAAPLPVPDEPEGGEASSASITRLLGAIRRYKWWILVLTLLGAAGGWVGSRFVHPLYVADATIWIDNQSQDDRTGPLQQGGLLKQNAWRDLLQSYAVLDYVVQEQRLYLEYAPRYASVFTNFTLSNRFRPGAYKLEIGKTGRAYQLTWHGSVVDKGQVGDSIGRPSGFKWQPSPGSVGKDHTIDFKVVPPRDAARELYRDLQVDLPEQGTFMRLSYRNQDPKLVAGVVNSVADRYISMAAQLKAAKMREVARILGVQLSTAENNLRDSEAALEGYKVKTITLPSERSTPVAPGLAVTTNPVLGRYFDMKVLRSTMANERDRIQQALGDGAGVSIDALSTIPSVNQSPELKTALDELTKKRALMRALEQQYTDEYRPMKEARTDIQTLEQQTIPRLARAVIANLNAQIGTYDQMVGSAGSELTAIPERVIEESRLERQVSVNQDLYTNLRRRAEEARLSAETSIADVRILDRATVPEDPATDRRLQVVLMAIFGCLALGIGGAIVLDRFDTRLRYPEEVSRRMGLPILGVIPGVKTRDGMLGESQVAQVLEALRGVRLSLSQAYGTAGPLVVTISSPGAGDGKSFVSANLALAFADLGYRTLVLDGDIRRGALHRLLGCSRKPGLTDYLSGRATREQIIQRTNTPLLDMIGSGTRLQNGPELLSSSTTAQLMAHLRSEYSVVLVDSPPLGAGVDPFLWGMLTGSLVVVLRAGKTDRAMAEAKLEALSRMPVRVLGAIMNGAAETGVYRYYSYLSGYETTEEASTEPPAQLEPALSEGVRP